jgi:hypothetical protein
MKTEKKLIKLEESIKQMSSFGTQTHSEKQVIEKNKPTSLKEKETGIQNNRAKIVFGINKK